MHSSPQTRDWDQMQNGYIPQQLPYAYQQPQHQNPLRPTQIKLANDNSHSYSQSHSNHHHYHHVQPQHTHMNAINNLQTTHVHLTNNYSHSNSLSPNPSPYASKHSTPTNQTYTSNTYTNGYIRYHSPIEPETPSQNQHTLQLNRLSQSNSTSQYSELSLEPHFQQHRLSQSSYLKTIPDNTPVLGSSPQPEIHSHNEIYTVTPYSHTQMHPMHKLSSNGSHSSVYSPDSIQSAPLQQTSPNGIQLNAIPHSHTNRHNPMSKSSFSLSFRGRKSKKKQKKCNNAMSNRARALSAQPHSQRPMQVQKHKGKGRRVLNVLNTLNLGSSTSASVSMSQSRSHTNGTDTANDVLNRIGLSDYKSQHSQHSQNVPNLYRSETAPQQQHNYDFRRNVNEQQFNPHSSAPNMHMHMQQTYSNQPQPQPQQRQRPRLRLNNGYTQPMHPHTQTQQRPPQMQQMSYDPYYSQTQNRPMQRPKQSQRHHKYESDSQDSISESSQTDYMSDSHSESTESDESNTQSSESQSRRVVKHKTTFSKIQRADTVKSKISNTSNNTMTKTSSIMSAKTRMSTHWSLSESDAIKTHKNPYGSNNEILMQNSANTISESHHSFSDITPNITPRCSMVFDSRQSHVQLGRQSDLMDIEVIYDNSVALVAAVNKQSTQKINSQLSVVSEEKVESAKTPSHLKLIGNGTRNYEKSKRSRIFLKQALKREILFVGLAEKMIDKMMEKMYKIEVPKNKCIIKQNEIGNAYFVVEKGKFIMIKEQFDTDGKNKKLKCVGTASAKSAFGEGSLLYRQPRSATLRAKEDSVVWALDSTEFTKIRHKLTRKKAAKSQKKVSFLQKVAMFSKFDIQDITDISEAIKPIIYHKGQHIISENEESKHFFIVFKGVCELYKDHKQVCTYGKYDYFGEDGILNDSQLSDYHIRASPESDVICYVLNAIEFKKIVNAIHYRKKTCNGSYKDVKYQNRKFKNVLKRIKNVTDANLLAHIGVMAHGNFGEVSLVEDTKTNKRYALKKMRKNRVIETKHTKHIRNERAILCSVNSKFVVKLYGTYSDDLSVYLLMEAVMGGELFDLLKFNKKLPEKTARFYAGCVILAFEEIHGLNVIFRDLKPRNLLISRNGYIKLIDFGHSKVRNQSCTLCGMPSYLAPEVIQCGNQSFTTDWWTVGVFIYELLMGYPPFTDDPNVKMYEKILSAAPEFPSNVKLSRACIDIITSLLRKHSHKRLGSGLYPFGVQRVKSHHWFKSLNWAKMDKQMVTPPYKPQKDTINTFVSKERESVSEVLIEDKNGNNLYDWCELF